MNLLNQLELAIRDKFMIRNTNDEKSLFREFIKTKMNESGYDLNEHNGNCHGSINLYFIPDKCEVIFTAHYDTPNKPISFIVYPFLKFCQKIAGGFLSLIPFIIFLLLFLFITDTFNVKLIQYLAGIDFLLLIVSLKFPKQYTKNKHNMNDNTSGVVTLLYLASILRANPKAGFIFFDNEENWLLGSKEFAKEFYNSNNTFSEKVLINLDCVSGTSMNDIIVISKFIKNARTLPTINTIISKLKESTKYKLVVKNKYSNSDYLSFKSNSSISIGLFKPCYLSGYYLENIPSEKDVILDLNNIKNLSHLLIDSLEDIY